MRATTPPHRVQMPSRDNCPFSTLPLASPMDVFFIQFTQYTLFRIRRRCMAGIAFQIFAAWGVSSMVIHRLKVGNTVAN